jgi:hypothetical protein
LARYASEVAPASKGSNPPVAILAQKCQRAAKISRNACLRPIKTTQLKSGIAKISTSFQDCAAPCPVTHEENAKRNAQVEVHETNANMCDYNKPTQLHGKSAIIVTSVALSVAGFSVGKRCCCRIQRDPAFTVWKCFITLCQPGTRDRHRLSHSSPLDS